MQSKKTILLVDDEEPVAMAQENALRRLGYECVVAYSGETAIELAASHPEIALVLMDVDLGKGLDGREAARRILARRNLPIVFLASHPERRMPSAPSLPSFRYMQKNSDDMELQASIETAFELFASHHEAQKNEEWQRLILKTVPIAIYTSPLDPAIDASWVSGDIEKVTGFTVDEYLGEKDFWRNRLHPDDREKVLNSYKNPAEGDETINEYRWLCKDGKYKWFYDRAIKKSTPQGIHYVGIILDISERQRAENLVRTRLRLVEFAAGHTLAELLQRTLDEVCALTDSPIGFYHFVDPDQVTLTLQGWSTRTLQEFCTATPKQANYDIADAGVWVDCIRQKRPVIHNDYAALPHRKGLPEGHAPVRRELVVPILRKEKIVAVLGIGNKEQDYSEKDIDLVAYFADVAWEIARRKQAEDALKQANLVVENSPVVTFRWQAIEGWPVAMVSKNVSQFGYTQEELLSGAIPYASMVYPEDLDRVAREVQEYSRGGTDSFHQEYRMVTKDGRIRWVEDSTLIERDSNGQPIYYQGVVIDITDRKSAEIDFAEEHLRLSRALDEVRTLRGIIPICANCKQIRDDKGYWSEVEKYVSAHTHAEFSHGICPKCMEELYPEFAGKEPKNK